MTKPMLKICGLKRESDVLDCMRLGVDILGFVVEYPIDVPWNLSRNQAQTLLQLVKPPQLSCLVTGGSAARIINLAEKLQPDLVQLHYHETLEDTRKIAEALLPLGTGVIKTVPSSEYEQMQQFGTNDLKIIIDSLNQTDIYAILADAREPSNAADTSTKLNPEFCRNVENLSKKPVIIAGGIDSDNISDLADQTGIYFFDIMTGVEIKPGVKNTAQITMAVAAVEKMKTDRNLIKREK